MATQLDKSKHLPRVAARVVILHQAQVLLLRAAAPGRSWYFLPGGHVNHGETLADAARREAREETGLEVDVLRPLFVREFIAARHLKRAEGVPQAHHALAVIFLCRINDAWLAGRDFRQAVRFAPDAGVRTTQDGAQWHALDALGELEIHPPHLKRALMGEFPPPESMGVQFWPED